MVIVKNVTETEKVWCGQTIAPAGQYTLETLERSKWSENSTFIAAIAAGQAVINNGAIDFTDINTAINFLKDIAPSDSDLSPMFRQKVTNLGWQYRLHGLEMKTSTFGSVVETDEDGNAFNFATLKFYNEANELMPTSTDEEKAALQSAETGAVKTVLDWEPTHDVELLGGRGKQLVKPQSPVRLWCRAVPGIPSAFGGNKLFISNINLQYVDVSDSVHSDGRAPKLLKYDATYHTNLLRFVMKHPKGFQHDLHFWMEFFRP